MNTYITNIRVVFPGERIASTTLRFADGRVASVGDAAPQAGDAVVDGGGRLLTPGLIDLHVHGIHRYSFDNGPDDMLAAARCFAAYGVTTVLPTVGPSRKRDMLARLSATAEALDRVEGVAMPGLHVEGPFTALPGAGCDVLPGDVGLLEELLAACGGRVCAMSLSPDTPGILPVIERLRERGIAPFVTHTRATVQQSQAAIAAGARHATHFYDVFPMPPERDPGVRPAGAVETYLADPAATVDFIADGCHVEPVAIQMAVRAKTCAGVAVISDANIGAGLPPGTYDTPWGYPVRVEPGNGARIADPKHRSVGALAGSALTMNVAMANVLKWIDARPEDIWQMGSSTPARIAGLANKGTLAVGFDADAVLWNDDLTPRATWTGGQASFTA
jgi:N-acetylglucosamine-6-phosphate deacetylase